MNRYYIEVAGNILMLAAVIGVMYLSIAQI